MKEENLKEPNLTMTDMRIDCYKFLQTFELEFGSGDEIKKARADHETYDYLRILTNYLNILTIKIYIFNPFKFIIITHTFI